jgi:hypothetical protein
MSSPDIHVCRHTRIDPLRDQSEESMSATALDIYDPHTFRALTFHDATLRFRDGTDTPRAYLERCLETIAAREPIVQAFAALNEAGARAAADARTARWLLETVPPVVVR